MKAMPLCLALGAACSSTTATDRSEDTSQTCATGLEIGQCPPDFALPDGTGQPVHLSDHVDGVVVASLFTGW